MSNQQPSQHDNEDQRGIGLCLDAEIPHVARYIGSPTEGRAVGVSSSKLQIPPSCLLPRLPGEPLRADCSWPCHPRGNGQPWPPESAVSSQGTGRFPLVYAWSSFHEEAPAGGNLWSWPDSEMQPPQPIHASDAIGEVASHLVQKWLNHNDAIEPTLVIPNHLKSADQQAIIDACRRRGVKVRLLWRPVAAALAWCDHYQQDLAKRTGEHDQPLGKVLAIHMGLDCLEVCILEIVSQRYNGELYFLPARGRPQGFLPTGGRPQGRPLHGLGVRLIEELASRFTKERMGVNDLACVWGLLWASPWLPAVLGILRGQSSQTALDHMPELGAPSDTEELLNRVWPSVYAGLTGKDSSPIVPLRQMLPSFPNAGGVAEWCKGQAEILRGTGALLGTVITGPMADVMYEGKSLGEQWLAKVGGSRERVLVEGRDVPHGILARMAAAHSMRLAAGLPTYLDTLPRVEMVVTEAGEPIWNPLLQKEDAYVDGGKEWHREGVNQGSLFLMENKTELDIDLNHGEYQTVRTVTLKLAEISRTRIPISLSVAIMPAQGNARVEVVPDKPGALGRRRLLVDWGTMANTKKTPQAWLKGFPRICPPVAVRRQSHDRWHAVMCLISEFLPGGLAARQSLERLNSIRLALQQPDQFNRDSYPLGSDGITWYGAGDLEKFVAHVTEYLLRPKGSTERKHTILRVLAHTYTPNQAFQLFLAEQIRRMGDQLDSHHLLPIGRCLRESKAIGEFARCALQRFERGHELTANWLRALSEVIKYRDDATQFITGNRGKGGERGGLGVCLSLTQHLLDIFEASFNLPGEFHPQIFGRSAVSVVYLLRRRTYEDDYLEPDHPLGKRAKRLFSLAQKYHKDGSIRIPGGMLNVEEELQKFIDYIDRRGRGAIAQIWTDLPR